MPDDSRTANTVLDVPLVWHAVNRLFAAHIPDALPVTVGTVLGVRIVLVDGDRVMLDHDPDFGSGSNPRALAETDPELVTPDYIPDGEVWVNSREEPGEWPYTALHEVIEFLLMGRGQDYEAAHAKANRHEMAYRRKAQEDGA